MPSLNVEYVVTEYAKGRSAGDIAHELNTYPNAVIRLLKKAGATLRTASEAQATAIKQGRHPHPTKGKPRSQEVRERISDSRARRWEEMTDEERRQHAERAKRQWEETPQWKREQMQAEAAEAIREAAKTGSKLEQFLHTELLARGFSVEFHAKSLLANDRLHVDIYLPRQRVAIEVDGPAHFLDIWGQENLDKHLLRDSQKSGLLLGLGLVVLRIKHTSKSVSLRSKRNLLNKVLAALESITKEFPPKTERLMEFEV